MFISKDKCPAVTVDWIYSKKIDCDYDANSKQIAINLYAHFNRINWKSAENI